MESLGLSKGDLSSSRNVIHAFLKEACHPKCVLRNGLLVLMGDSSNFVSYWWIRKDLQIFNQLAMYSKVISMSYTCQYQININGLILSNIPIGDVDMKK